MKLQYIIIAIISTCCLLSCSNKIDGMPLEQCEKSILQKTPYEKFDIPLTDHCLNNMIKNLQVAEGGNNFVWDHCKVPSCWDDTQEAQEVVEKYYCVSGCYLKKAKASFPYSDSPATIIKAKQASRRVVFYEALHHISLCAYGDVDYTHSNKNLWNDALFYMVNEWEKTCNNQIDKDSGSQ